MAVYRIKRSKTSRAPKAEWHRVEGTHEPIIDRDLWNSVQKKRLASDMEVYKKNISEYTKGIRAVYMDKVKGLISENDYAEMSKDFIAERDRLNHAVADKEKQLAERNEKIKADDNRRELIRQYTNLEHLIDCHPHAGF